MKTLSTFLTKFSSIITWVLSCFDRVIFEDIYPSAAFAVSRLSSITF